MRYCIVCGSCLESHNLSLKYCKKPACQDVKLSRNPAESMRRIRREQKLLREIGEKREAA